MASLGRTDIKYVAVKVGIAGPTDKREADILSRLATEGSRSTTDKTSGIPVVIDRFDLAGPNGSHPCFVTVPAMCSLRDLKEPPGKCQFQLDVAQSLSAQLAMAISHVHSQGIVHADLHLGNMLLKLPSTLNNLSIDQFYEEFGEPEPEPVVRIDGKPIPPHSGVPSHAVPPVWLGKQVEEFTLEEVGLLLVDFGVAFCPREEDRYESYTPIIIQPPEAMFEPTTPLSFPSDIWSLGCVIFELLAHRHLIDANVAFRDDVISQYVELQGMMPPEWWAKWEARFEWFDEAGNWTRGGDLWTWEKRFKEWIQATREKEGLGTIDEEEKAALFEMLQWMLAWKPEERPTIKEVLDTAWMKNWALPAHHKSLQLQSRFQR